MSYLQHVVRTKGVLHSFERSAQIILRYTFGKKRFARMMAELDSEFKSPPIRVTFCVTASLLEDHLPFLKSFSGKGHEFAAHGYFHTNMRNKSVGEQLAMLTKSYASFEKYGIGVSGFRCPYLSYCGQTMKALSKSPYHWTSNNLIFWEDGEGVAGKDTFREKIRHIYSTASSEKTLSVPKMSGRIVDIPITAPDDEMLLERYRVRNPVRIRETWTRIFRKVHERGELFHLLFHPERFSLVSSPINALIKEAMKTAPPVWFTTLDEIARWWAKKKDMSWYYKHDSNGNAGMSIKAPPGSFMLMKSEKGDSGFYKNYRKAEPASVDANAFYFKSKRPSCHTISVSDGSSPLLGEFLRSEGFLVQTEGSSTGDSLVIGDYADFKEEDKLPLLEKIDNSPHPLIRIWRWPEGRRSAFVISSDVDSIIISDFFKRVVNF